MKKGIILTTVFAAVAVMIGLRIYSVNASAPQQQYEYYELNQWVSYDGCFMVDFQEHTQGYSARVLSAKFVSYDEYIKENSLPEDVLSQELRPTMMIDAEVEFINESSEDGFISLPEMCCFSPGDNVSYMVDATILCAQLPQLDEWLQFSLKPGGDSVVIHLPLTLPVFSNGYKTKETGRLPKYLGLTKTPVKKLVKIIDSQ